MQDTVSTDSTQELPVGGTVDVDDADEPLEPLEPLLAGVLARLERAGLRPRVLARWPTGAPAAAPAQEVLDTGGR
jgi:hypothetical protein